MRLFTGLSLGISALEKLARILAELRPAADLKWSPVENLHITTAFIGDWPERRLPDLQSAFGDLAPAGTISISIAHFGFFPNPQHPRAFFAGVQASPALHDLARRIGETVTAIHGGPTHTTSARKEDPPYTPHVTLARIKNENIQGLRQRIASMTDFEFGSFEAADFHLYQSQGGAYTRLASYSLLQAA